MGDGSNDDGYKRLWATFGLAIVLAMAVIGYQGKRLSDLESSIATERDRGTTSVAHREAMQARIADIEIQGRLNAARLNLMEQDMAGVISYVMPGKAPIYRRLFRDDGTPLNPGR